MLPLCAIIGGDKLMSVIINDEVIKTKIEQLPIALKKEVLDSIELLLQRQTHQEKG